MGLFKRKKKDNVTVNNTTTTSVENLPDTITEKKGFFQKINNNISVSNGCNDAGRKNDNIEKRLQNMKNFYLKASEYIDNIPDVIPENIKSMIKDKILNDAELRELMNSIDSHRPPRIFLIGKTGAGKSSLINALFGIPVADVSDVESCKPNQNEYLIKDGNRILMEVFDTRGISESQSIDDNISAENQLIEQINDFSPDAAVLVLNGTQRDGIGDIVDFLKKVAEEYEKKNNVSLPVVAVVNKCDQIPPVIYIDPHNYPDRKIQKINEIIRYYENIIVSHKLMIKNIIPVSSLIEWQDINGDYIDSGDIAKLSPQQRELIKIGGDYRYNIEKLFRVLENSISDTEAQRGMKMAFKIEELVKRISNKLIAVFAGISGIVAATPIPIADVYILLIIQAILVALIASISGRDMSLDTAKEFIASVGGVIGMGYTFRTIAHQLLKLFPGGGNVIGAVIASSGTSAIGKAAVAYYIENKNISDVKRIFNKNNNSKETTGK